MNIPFLFFTSEQIIDSHLRYSDIFYFMFSTFVQTKVRPKKSGTDEGQRHLLMYGEIEESIPCACHTAVNSNKFIRCGLYVTNLAAEPHERWPKVTAIQYCMKIVKTRVQPCIGTDPQVISQKSVITDPYIVLQGVGTLTVDDDNQFDSSDFIGDS